MLAPWKKSSDKPRQCIKNQRIKKCYFVNSTLQKSYSQSFGFSSSYVWIWELDRKEGWAPKHQLLLNYGAEKDLKSSLDSNEIQPVNLRGNQPWIFIVRIDAEIEAPLLWPPDTKGQPTGEDPDTGKDWGQEEGATEDEMVGWHHRINGHEFE